MGVYAGRDKNNTSQIEKYFAEKEKEYEEQDGSDGGDWDEAREELVSELIAKQDVQLVEKN